MGTINQAELDNLCINTIRMLSADAVETAKSGHPGLPMGAAAFAYALWMNHLRFNPQNPDWINRDRFVLSAGHGSMLLYSLLHLTGYDLPLDELKRFRQWGSRCPGHPEHGMTPGVETTTGPLGQGFANGIGMALAERFLAERYNREGHDIIDYFVYALVSDGDLMEGISSEAASFAGGLKLGKLIYMYDSNRISIEGSTDLAFHEDTAKRFEAYGWHTLTVEDGNDTAKVDLALREAKQDPRPSLIILPTHIGFGSPGKQDSAASHGSPLGGEELAKTKENLGWPVEPMFHIPPEALEHMRGSLERGADLEHSWNEKFNAYKEAYPDLAQELATLTQGKKTIDWQTADLPSFSLQDPPMATREASGVVMNAIAAKMPLFLGGSADLGPSNNTRLKDFGDITCEGWQPNARNLHFGVREHAMGGILNGLALSRAIVPFGGTFLTFSDYMRGAMRLSSIMKQRVVYVLTHDSIGQGEDGTTHQPIEHLASLRAMPGMTLIRPADANETAEAWRQALQIEGPTSLVLTRQKLPVIDRSGLSAADGLRCGAYTLKDCDGSPDILLIATGSEVILALEASNLLSEKGVKARVISMPSNELFEQQSDDYKAGILPEDGPPRLIIEAASSFGWSRYMGVNGDIISIDVFGASAPGPVMMEKFGFTVDNVVKRATQLLETGAKG